VTTALERWADEDAAAAVGDRALTARALARAALARSGHRRASGPAGALAAADHDVLRRAEALYAPKRRVSALEPVLGAAVIATWAAAVIAIVWAHDIIEIGESLYRR
jgi:hypothetical protein